MRKIAVALTKGGVGKTTTAVHLAAGLAESGQRVVLIDCDSQGQAARALGCTPVTGLAEVVIDEVPAQGALVEARPRLWVLAGGRGLAALKRDIARRDFGGEQVLAEALAPLTDYDMAILDTGPGWDALTVNVLFYADEVLAPVALEVMALQGLSEFMRSLSAIQRYRAALELRYVVPTFLDRRVRKSDEILQQLCAHYGERVCPPIRYNVRLSEAPGYGQTVYEYAPSSPGATDYRRLTERILADGRA